VDGEADAATLLARQRRPGGITSTPSSLRRCIAYRCGLYALRVVPRAPNFCALRRVSSNFERA
jgi:hypothetical protein